MKTVVQNLFMYLSTGTLVGTGTSGNVHLNLRQHFLYELYLEYVSYKNLHCSSGIYIMTARDSYRNDNIHDMQCGNEAVSELRFKRHAN